PDWLYGGNGIANDYGAASGTSMAAPYVAGAATLVRQAMEFVGMTNITQDTVYNQLRSTADAFHDTATQANYFRINVGRAIDSLMPSDDFGNTTTTGAQLGTLGNDTALSGVVGKLSDVDSFTFTAGVSGKLTLDATVRDYLTADIKIVGATAQNNNGQLSFQITAGQQYTIQIGTKSGIGHYSLDVGITADQQPTTPVTNWGEIAFAQFANQRISGESWFQISATRSGLLSLETFTNGNSNLRVELLDANRQVVASTSTAANYGRLDATVQAGGSYLVRVVGDASDADFRLTNLISQAGNTVNIFGTAGADTFSFTAGSQHVIDINGVSYRFDARAVTNVNFSGQGGSDSATLVGSAQHESASFTPTTASLASSTYRVNVNGASQVSIDGRAGSDRLELTGSAGDDVLSLARNDVSLIGGGMTLRGIGFSTVNVNASSGNDLAQLYDTSGNDRFTGYATHAALQGAGYLHTVRGFDRVTVTASGGDDTAYLYDSAGDDIFQATPTSAALAGQGYSNTVVGFDRVFATASSGHDVAYLVDSAGNDRFYGRHNVSWLTGGGFYNSAAGFDQAFASATAGGIDIAYLYDNAGDGVYYTSARQATVRGESFENSALGFAKVSAHATQGSIRTQMLETADTSPVDNYKAAYFADLGTNQTPTDAIASTALTRAQLAELLVSFDFITAHGKARSVKDDMSAVDYLFAQEGE
ncbi:MAG TPA: S8 family serine peptidase, partial [Pirellulaceae bacterium]|nr:S8 family serine peptidase [Pirellulaceae bacterium]